MTYGNTEKAKMYKEVQENLVAAAANLKNFVESHDLDDESEDVAAARSCAGTLTTMVGNFAVKGKQFELSSADVAAE